MEDLKKELLTIFPTEISDIICCFTRNDYSYEPENEYINIISVEKKSYATDYNMYYGTTSEEYIIIIIYKELSTTMVDKWSKKIRMDEMNVEKYKYYLENTKEFIK